MAKDKPETAAPEVPSRAAVKAAASGSGSIRTRKWRAGVCRRRTRQARQEALALYRANPDITPDEIKAQVEQGAAQTDPHMAGLDPVTIMMIIDLIIKLVQWWQQRKAEPASLAALAAGEPCFEWDPAATDV